MASLPVVDLEETTALDKSLVGAKAAALARARRRGLPVLPGFVLPAEPARALLEDLLGEVPLHSRQLHAASLSFMEKATRELDLAAAVERARSLGTRLVVRSSSPLEDDALWSGALSSFVDLEPEQLPTAVAGCWASTLKPAVAELCERTGASLGEACPAALVQPFLEAVASGVATTAGSLEGVQVVAVWGSPVPLFAGWEDGWAASVRQGRAEGPALDPMRCPRPFPAQLLEQLAELVEAAAAGSAATVEWAAARGRLYLLQVRPAPSCSAAGLARPSPGEAAAVHAPQLPQAPLGHPEGQPARTGRSGPGDISALERPTLGSPPELLAAARSAARFGGPIGDEAVLPWMLPAAPALKRAAQSAWASATEDAERPGPGAARKSAMRGARQTYLRAWRRGRELARATWPAGPEEPLAAAAAGDLASLSRGLEVDPEAACAAMRDFGTAASRFVEAGVIAHPEQLWSLEPDEVLDLLEAPRPAEWHTHRHRGLRWRPLLLAAAANLGVRRAGAGVAPGLGVGPPCPVDAPSDLRSIRPGTVAVVRRPNPQLAPALWVASGLVAESGSGAAHLLEVARALRVPAVVGLGSLGAERRADLVLVDGDTGETSWLL